MKLYAVVLCGGKGERFWPKSRHYMPKQFLQLFGNRTLLQETSERIAPLAPLRRQLFVASRGFGKTLRRQLPLKDDNLLFEPSGKNTAPAIGLAAAQLAARDPDATMVVLPADHHIKRKREFLATVRLAARVAQDGQLVTFGVPPTRPDTGYGYIKVGDKVAGRGASTAHHVLGFREKPDAKTARRYLDSGDFLWNSGMFVWRADAILAAFRKFMPRFASGLRSYMRSSSVAGRARIADRLYREVESISIDYAVMEKAKNIVAVRAAFTWDDVGSWLALERHRKQDRQGNTASGDCVLKDSEGCIVESDAGLVAMLGTKDLVVVRSGDAVLVCPKNRLPDIKKLLRNIAADKAGRDYL